ncbi:hypothetical protein TNCV_3848901 [Trichonephila clavipes]|uniref:Uncharacterized protein n=1 Tax=Trichonephila clavipes TaxID=2585209 RepID=A0A8X6RH19_TRICX|nr:hypothetical protein TNCV_3848901 [Trichonephila clavipes]
MKDSRHTNHRLPAVGTLGFREMWCRLWRNYSQTLSINLSRPQKVSIFLTVTQKKPISYGAENTRLGWRMIKGKPVTSRDSEWTATRDVFSSGKNPVVDIGPLTLSERSITDLVCGRILPIGGYSTIDVTCDVP